MLAPQTRSSSKKSSRHHERDSPDLRDKCGSYLLGSKIGDLSQRTQTTCSKELDNRRQKNPAESNEYIRNLYKKYLGKENSGSDRKTKTDCKQSKAGKIQSNEQVKQKLNYEPEVELIKIRSTLQKSSHLVQQNSSALFKKPATIGVEQARPSIIQNCRQSNQPIEVVFYDKLLDSDIVQIVGDRRNPLVLAMHTINAIRRRNR